MILSVMVYIIMVKTSNFTAGNKTQHFIAKEAGCSLLYKRILVESWVKEKYVVGKMVHRQQE